MYRKYRPKSFADAVGQKHITDTLESAIKSGRISHAYLFTGPKGVGKTSIARILAHAVNDLDYDDESTHLDIIEIDAASNRRIDEIRDLRDKVHISPTSAKYKVYIIDEVHMLTREAFNALLKTLEEPPAHCIFILATTESHKLPETITSRTQKFEFKPISVADAVSQLKTIANKEKITVSDKALGLIAEHGQGSFRDSISLLDQLRSSSAGEIDESQISQFLGLPNQESIDQIIDAINQGNPQRVVEHLGDMFAYGSNATVLSNQIAKTVRQEFIKNSGGPEQLKLLRELLTIAASPNPERLLEIILVEAALNNPSSGTPAKDENIIAPPKEQYHPATEAKVNKARPTETKKSASIREFNDTTWDEITDKVKNQAASIYTALRLAKPSVSDDKLILAFKFPLHQKKINQAQHKDLISKVVSEITGQKLIIEAVVSQDAPGNTDNKPALASAKPEVINTISNIFGNAEMLES